MTKYGIHNWTDLSGDTPEFLALREEVLRQLARVPEPHRSIWEGRLKSKLEHSHSSARLEICLFDFFKKWGWEIEIEPELPSTLNKPDFRLTSGNRTVIVEARTVLGVESETQQDRRLMQLMSDLRGKLKRTILIHPMSDLLPSLPNNRIGREIEIRASESEMLQEFLVEGEHQGQIYSLEVTVLLDTKPNPSADVGATVSQAIEVDIGNPVRKAIIEKAHKYGEIFTPYVIAVWPKLPYHVSFASDDDLVALYGDRDWQDPDNGIFTIREKDGTHRYSDVSAVLFCHPYNTDSSKIYIHHNPFAKRPIGIDMFKGIPQCSINLVTGKEHWLEQ